MVRFPPREIGASGSVTSMRLAFDRKSAMPKHEGLGEPVQAEPPGVFRAIPSELMAVLLI
jgi:hypothetical protein